MISFRPFTPVLAMAALSLWGMGCDSSGANNALSANPASAKVQQQAPGGAKAEEADEAIDLSQVPQVVLDAVQQALPGGKILAAAYEDENGQMLYGFEVRTEAGQRDIKVDDQGKVVKIENDDAAENETDHDAIEEGSGAAGDTGIDNDAVEVENESGGNDDSGSEND